MVEVTQQSANWRLFGGGGFALGGLLWALGAVLSAVELAGVGFWVATIGTLIVGVAFFFVAFGQTGSNGAVGALGWGKVVLVIAGAALILAGIAGIIASFAVAIPAIVTGVLLAVFVVAGIAGAIAIFGRGVAKGIAKWILFAPVVVSILLAVAAFGVGVLNAWWVALVVGVLFLAAGVFYLFNKVDVSK